jgi:hypothetical protein
MTVGAGGAQIGIFERAFDTQFLRVEPGLETRNEFVRRARIIAALQKHDAERKEPRA